MIGVDKGFKGLTPFMQQAVVLKAHGTPHVVIADKMGRSVKSVERWFGIEGVLKKPLAEYSEAMANEALTEARVLMRQALPSAIQTLDELARKSTNASVRQQAAKVLAQPSIVAVAKSVPAKTPTASSQLLNEMIDIEIKRVAANYEEES